MPGNDWSIKLLEVVKSEHEELADLLAETRDALSADDRNRHQIEDLVARLSGEVESHFGHEERGGYFQEALARAPRYTAQAEALLNQHEALLEDVEKLRLLLRSGVESAAWWTRIESDFHKFATELLDHEHAENKLLQEAFTDDLGVGD